MKKRILLTFRCFFVTNCMLLVLFQEQIMRNDIGQFFGIMRYHNHGLVFSSAKSRNNLTRQLTITVVQSVQRFIQDKQFRVFDECAGQQTEPLLSAGELHRSQRTERLRRALCTSSSGTASRLRMVDGHFRHRRTERPYFPETLQRRATALSAGPRIRQRPGIAYLG